MLLLPRLVALLLLSFDGPESGKAPQVFEIPIGPQKGIAVELHFCVGKTRPDPLLDRLNSFVLHPKQRIDAGDVGVEGASSALVKEPALLEESQGSCLVFFEGGGQGLE